MDITGLIILIVTLLGFVGLAIFAIVYGRKHRFPEGDKFEAEFAGNKAILIVDKDVPNVKDQATGKVNGWLVDGVVYKADELARKCALAIHAAELAFKEKGLEGADVDKVVIHFQTDHNFENPKVGPSWWNAWSKNVAAYAGSISRNMGFWGGEIPMAVIRAKHMKALEDRGQPVVHELVHILNKEIGAGYQHDHSDPNLWAGAGGQDSAEQIGVRQWKDLV